MSTQKLSVDLLHDGIHELDVVVPRRPAHSLNPHSLFPNRECHCFGTPLGAAKITVCSTAGADRSILAVHDLSLLLSAWMPRMNLYGWVLS